MSGETNIKELIKGMAPVLNEGDYVFTTVKNAEDIQRDDVICEFKEAEGTTLVLERKKADKLKLPYEYVASWITLTIHSSLEAVGLTALFSKALADQNISCNVIAGYYHDHIFVDINDSQRAIHVLNDLAANRG